MKASNSKKLGFLATAAAFVLVTAGPVQAAMKLKLDDTFSDIVISDGGAGDFNPGIGAITFIGSLGVWNINTPTGISKDLIGSADDPRLDLNSLNINGGGPGVLTISLTDTDFVSPNLEGLMSLAFTVGGTTDGLVDVAGYYDSENREFFQGQQIASFEDLGSGGFTMSEHLHGEFVGLGPFSMTLVATITHERAGYITSLDVIQEPVPEPASLAMVGLGLLAFGFAKPRRAPEAA